VNGHTLAKFADILRNDFTAFTHRAYVELRGTRSLDFNWHFDVLAEKLEDVRVGRSTRLIINLPTRHLKSFMGSVAFPAFLLGHNPTAEVLCISYGQDLSDPLAIDCRNLMLSEFYKSIFPTRLVSEQQAVDELRTKEGGIRRARALTGSITGIGADYIIIDDPIKAAEAESQARRTAVNNAFYSTIDNRLNDKEKGAIVVIMQRLHPEDFTASIQEREKWDVVALPALAEANENYSIRTPYGVRKIARRQGEALHPSRESAERLNVIRQKEPYVFSAQYQQNPMPRDGGIIKAECLKYYPRGSLSNLDRIIQSWDTANKDGEKNSFNVCTTWAVNGRQFYLLDVFREQMLFDRLKSNAERLARQFNPTTIVIEPQATGAALLAEMRRQNFPVQAAPASGDSKRSRLEAKIDYFTGGCVHLPDSAVWLADYVDEITRFPYSKFSDQVDSTVQALAMVELAENTSYSNAIGWLQMQIDEQKPKRMRVRFPPGHGMVIGRDGHQIPIINGIGEINAEDYGGFLRVFPKLEKL